jgi:chemotaxis response regulator CheB
MRERAIGVIFSGTDTEGAIVPRAIKGVGGLVLPDYKRETIN